MSHLRPSLAEIVAERRSEIMVEEAFKAPVRGHAPSGQLNGAMSTRSLTAPQVVEIRQRTARGENRGAIAEAMGVEKDVVRGVVTGATYRWVR